MTPTSTFIVTFSIYIVSPTYAQPGPLASIFSLKICKAPRDPLPIDLLNGSVQVFTKNQTTQAIAITGLNDAAKIVNDLDNKGYFALGRQVVFITHGFMQNQVAAPWMNPLKDKILSVDDSTIFIVYWTVKADVAYYPQAASNTQSVAAFVAGLAQAVQNLNTFANNADQLYLHCIGHSLGAHVCGQAGRMNGYFNRTTGLDPAGPGFNCSSWSHLRINASSGACVDNIHTEGGGFAYSLDPIPYWGTLLTWGHIDFYPNAGLAVQPGCNINALVLQVGFPKCSHGRAVDLFVPSVTNPAAFSSNGTCTDVTSLPASCSNTTNQNMGYFSSCYKGTNAVLEGVYYLPTDPSIPLYWLNGGYISGGPLTS